MASQPQNQKNQTSTAKSQEEDIAPAAIATGLGWLMGGPLGAAILGGAGYVVNQLDWSAPNAPSAVTEVERYRQFAQYYLGQFSSAALTALQNYEQTAEQIILAPLVATASESAKSSYHHQQHLTLLQNTLATLVEAIDGM
jgi:hypothetical protein